MAEMLQLCTFSLGDRLFALPVSEVREVVRGLEVTEVPLAPDVVRGLANLRGQIATAVDLRRRLEMEPRLDGVADVNIVVDVPEGLICLIVDDIGDVIDVPAASLTRPPDTLRPTLRELVKGICRVDDSLVLLLDTSRAVDAGLTRRPAAT